MNREQFIALNPCKLGLIYALSFPTIKEAFMNCKDTSNIIWLINNALKEEESKERLIIFSEECAGRSFTYADTYADDYAAAAANSAAYAASDDHAAYAACVASDSTIHAAAAYADAYADAEREIQSDRLKELFTDLIFKD